MPYIEKSAALKTVVYSTSNRLVSRKGSHNFKCVLVNSGLSDEDDIRVGELSIASQLTEFI